MKIQNQNSPPEVWSTEWRYFPLCRETVCTAHCTEIFLKIVVMINSIFHILSTTLRKNNDWNHMSWLVWLFLKIYVKKKKIVDVSARKSVGLLIGFRTDDDAEFLIKLCKRRKRRIEIHQKILNPFWHWVQSELNHFTVYSWCIESSSSSAAVYAQQLYSMCVNVMQRNDQVIENRGIHCR